MRAVLYARVSAVDKGQDPERQAHEMREFAKARRWDTVELVSPAKPDQRKRRKRMAARSGQRGYIERKGKYWRVRFWLDVPGQFKRQHKAVRICPIEGEGALSKTERQKKALEILSSEGANNEDRLRKVEAESCIITFREQSQVWLQAVSTRKRKPIKPHTFRSWNSHLVWLNSKIGDAPLSAISNRAMKDLVSEMAEAEFTPRTMQAYVFVVKAVVASLVNDEGEPVFHRNGTTSSSIFLS